MGRAVKKRQGHALREIPKFVSEKHVLPKMPKGLSESHQKLAERLWRLKFGLSRTPIEKWGNEVDPRERGPVWTSEYVLNITRDIRRERRMIKDRVGCRLPHDCQATWSWW